MKAHYLIIFLLLYLHPGNGRSQLRGVSLLAGGETVTHRLVSPHDAAGLEFAFEFGQSDTQTEQSFFGGIRADWELKGQVGLQTQLDYGRVIYNVFFRDPTETNGIFGPMNRGVFYAPDRLDLSLLPSYTVAVGKFELVPKAGISYSIPVAEREYTNKVPDRSSQVRAVAIENALNRSFGRSTWKVNAGLDIAYARFFAHFNLRHQITSASESPVQVDGVEGGIPFDNRLTAIQFGLGYRVLRFD